MNWNDKISEVEVKRCQDQARIQEQLSAINPVLANPDEFKASLRR